MNFYKKYKCKYYINYAVIGLLLLAFGIISLAGGLKASALYLLEKMAISMILAVSLNLVVGLLGELSLGHAGFMCVGAYLGGKIAAVMAPSLGENSLTVFLASLTVGGLCAGLCGILIGLPALRLKGDYLAVVTLAFGEIVRVIFKNSSTESFGGAMGMATPRFDKKYLFMLAFVLVLVTLFVIQNLMRSKHGRAVTAIRDNEIAARATGVNVTKYKLTVFTVSAVFAGIAGVLYSFSNYNVQFEHFDYNYSIEILVMIVLGGLGSLNGSLISAALITFLNVKLSDVLTGNLAVLQNLVYAVILILVVIYGNAPSLRGFREKYNLRTLRERLFRKKEKPGEQDPSIQRDDAHDWSRVPTKIAMDEVLSTDFSTNPSGIRSEGDKEGKS